MTVEKQLVKEVEMTIKMEVQKCFTLFHSSTGGGNAPRNVAMSHERQEDCKLLKRDVNDAEFKILVIQPLFAK